MAKGRLATGIEARDEAMLVPSIANWVMEQFKDRGCRGWLDLAKCTTLGIDEQIAFRASRAK